MSFYGIENNPINFSIIPDPLVTPVPISHLVQFPNLVDLGPGNGSLSPGDLLAGSLYFNTTGASTWTLPSGTEMMKCFGNGMDKYVGAGAIVRLEVVNYGSGALTISGTTGSGSAIGQRNKTFTAGNGTGACDCLNLKFTTSTGSYIVF